MKSIIYIGMDVHKKTYSLCAIYGNTGEILGETKIEADVKLVEKFITNAKKKVDVLNVEIKAGYEAGCLGYSLYWELTQKGISCDILAPTTMQRSSKNKVVKNDRRDAMNIATNLANGTYKSVYVPNDHDVEVKEYIRMMNDFKLESKKVKQHINAFVLRLGYKYEGKSRWIPSHIKWLKGLEMKVMYREILDEYLSQLDLLTTKIERFQLKLEELSLKEPYKEKIGKLRCFKGIDTTAAMILHVEVSDFERFPNAKAFSSFCGLTPSENSSGEKTSRQSITKQGNSTIRTTLVEVAQVLVRGKQGVKGKRLKSKQKGEEVKVIDYADKAVLRLQKKYHRMIQKGVHKNKVITAIARELACFVWGIETGNIA
ncbi:MAG: IS110 family transposase [Coprobacillus sp.]